MNESEAELRSNLKTLVELDLFFKVRALKEGTEIKPEEMSKVRKEVINTFLENLANEYKKLPDCNEIVYTALTKLEQRNKDKDDLER